jgi:hypothetical protein
VTVSSNRRFLTPGRTTSASILTFLRTHARQLLVGLGVVSQVDVRGVPWYHLTATDSKAVAERLEVLTALHEQTTRQKFSMRVGQALEIATWRALSDQNALQFFGDFPDIDSHDDSTLYKKTEPPSRYSNRNIGGRKLDFLVFSSGITAGIEIKNIRPWIYPNHTEIRELLWKCCTLRVVPVLIARRIHYSTFSVLNPCGVIIHQTYNQRYPLSEAAFCG